MRVLRGCSTAVLLKNPYCKGEEQTLTGKDQSSFLVTLAAERVIAILRCPGAAQAVESAKALIAEGIRIIEVSLNTPGAVEAIKELSAHCANIPGTVIGAGTVLDAGTAERVGAAGARFFVAPTFDSAAVTVANDYGMAPIPGCATPTEMLRAHQADTAAIKVFPTTLWTLRVCRTLSGLCHFCSSSPPVMWPSAKRRNGWPQVRQGWVSGRPLARPKMSNG
jgi:Entner-Doudoroff aldolase